MRKPPRRGQENSPTAPASPAICARADLVRALARGDERLLRATADRLGFEPIERAEPKTQTRGRATDETRHRAGTGVATEPRVLQAPLTPVTFWQPVEYSVAPAPEQPPPPRGPTQLPVWSKRPKRLARGRPLAPWHELLPRLRSAVAEHFETRALDLPAVVHRLSRGEGLERLPRRRRRRWGLTLQLIEDRSDHLAPYWQDQERIGARLLDLFPHHAVERALALEGLDAPLRIRSDGALAPYRLPPPGALVVVLGDLGCLDRGTRRATAPWVGLGQRLRADGCRTLALTPAPACPPLLARYWTLLRWERTPPTLDPEPRAALVERLLVLCSHMLRVEPGLLRELRLLIGADAGAEAELWQHPAITGRSPLAASMAAGEARRRRRDFGAEEPELKQRALDIQRAWRAGLPPEIWQAEVQAVAPADRAYLAEPEDIEESNALVTALANQVAGAGGARPVPGAMPWFGEVAQWLPGHCLQDPELGQHYHRIWGEILRRNPHAAAPSALRPERLVTQAAERTLELYQAGFKLLCSDGPVEARAASRLGPVRSANGLVRVEAEDPSDAAAFWEGGAAPPWADDWGWDDYGAWVSFSVEGKHGDRVSQRMRWIEPGSFTMGSPDDEPERYSDEGPQHRVTLAEGFWLFDTACTQALWEAVTGDNPSRFQGAERPVEKVSWDQVQGFIERLNRRLRGLALSLPSEAQWEYACRAGTETPFSFGENITPEQVNYDGNYPYAEGKKGEYRQETVPVKSLPANAWGLYEMHGNVWEWVQDFWHDDYRGAPADGTSWETTTGGGRVIRGGSWRGGARGVRAAVRAHRDPDGRDGPLGFRCARDQGREPSGQAPERAERASLARPGPRSGKGRAAPGSARGAGGRELPVGGERNPSPTLLRLDSVQQASAPLPPTATIVIRTDRERLTLRRLTKPDWASAIGRDRYGLWTEVTIEPDTGAPVVQRLRWLSPGRFRMGSPDDEPGRYDDEGPRHEVVIGKGCWLFDTPCTQALWQALVGDNPSRFQDPERPVEQVSWNDVVEQFLPELNRRIPGFVLPSEAQWEYACRAGTETTLYTGPIEIRGDMDAPALDAIAWYGGNSGVSYDLAEGEDSTKGWWEGKQKQYPHERAGTRKVKGRQPNPWGLYDMLGNVWEWCRDGMREYGTEQVGDPSGPEDSGAARVIRGGSWLVLARNVRAAVRLPVAPDDRYHSLGFRCARAQGS